MAQGPNRQDQVLSARKQSPRIQRLKWLYQKPNPLGKPQPINPLGSVVGRLGEFVTGLSGYKAKAVLHGIKR